MDSIVAYKNSLKKAWGYNDYNDWPIKFNSIMHLFLTEFSKEFINDLEDGLAHFSRKKIAAQFNNPARIYRIIHSIIYGMKKQNYSIEQQRNVTNILLEMTADLKFGSAFNEDGHNIIEKDLNKINEYHYHKSNNQDAKKLHRFFGLMWAYTESIFFRAHDVTKEFHGLYSDSKSKIMVREYYNLRPKELWGDIQFIDYSNLKIVAYYTNDLDITLDAYNHIYFHKGNYIDNMIKYYIEADNKEITLDGLIGQIENIEACIDTIHSWVSKSSPKMIVNRYADIYWFRKKPLADLLHKDWRVPCGVRKNIEKGDVDQRRLKRMTDREIDFMISTLL